MGTPDDFLVHRSFIVSRAATLLVLGVVLFSGDITLRSLTGASPWRMAAPTGGVMLIVGWLWLSVAAFLGREATA